MKTITLSLLIVAMAIFAWSCENATSERANHDHHLHDHAAAPSGGEYLDATKVAAEHYRLLSESGPVRLVEMYLPAGERDATHSHMHETVFFIKGGSARIYVGDEEMEVNLPDGYVLHHEPWTHSVENIGDESIHAIIFERMSLDAVIPAKEHYIDATEAASEHYKLLSEKDQMRVIHMKLPPGESDNMHSHYFETVYFLSGGKARIHVGDKYNEVEITDGYVLHHEPWTHRVENIGETTIEAIIFEWMPE